MSRSSRQLVTLRREGYTAIVTLHESTFTSELLASFNDVLDAVESDETVRALVTTNEGKIYSNGLPLQLSETLTRNEMMLICQKMIVLTRRILTFTMVTVAAIRGHAFAGGAALSLAHDYRVMCTGRGWFCLPEIKVRGNLVTLRVVEISKMIFLKTKLPPDQYTNCLLYGKRYTAEEAKRWALFRTVVR